MLPNLKLLRKEYGISQQVLADMMGVSQQSINQYENHSIEPDIALLTQMADYFNTSIDYIVGRTTIRRPILPNGRSICVHTDVRCNRKVGALCGFRQSAPCRTRGSGAEKRRACCFPSRRKFRGARGCRLPRGRTMQKSQAPTGTESSPAAGYPLSASMSEMMPVSSNSLVLRMYS